MVRVIWAFFFLFLANLPAPVFASEDGLEAEDVIPYLIGHWRFELGERTGGRIYTPLFGDNSAQIEEYFDELPIIGRGLVQYSSTDGVFSSALYFNVGENDFVTGILNAPNQSIVYKSTKAGNENLEIVFHILGPDHFEFNNFRIENGNRTRVLHADFYRVK